MISRTPRILLAAAFLLVLAACSPSSEPATDAPATQAPVEQATATLPGAFEATATVTVPDPTAGPAGTPPPTATPPPTPVPAPYQGESIMGLELIGPGFGNRAALAREAGAFWIRYNAIFWSDVEPNQGDEIWKALLGFEQQVLSLNASNLKLIAIVRSTPLWAQAAAGDFCGPVAEHALADFGDFLFDLVSKYSAEPFNIKYWELGNEPDVDPRFVDGTSLFGCWGDEDDPYYGGATYATMLRAVYPRIKEADPDAQVLIGGLLLDCDPNNPPETAPGSGVLKDCTPSRYLEGILLNGGGDYFDGVSFHAYDFYDTTSGLFGNPNWHSGYTLSGLTPVVVPKARYIRSVLAQYGYFDKYLLNTETALLCGKTGDEPECNTNQFHRMKADYVAMSYAAATAEGMQANIWFTLDNPWRRTSLTASDGTPYPAFYAYQLVGRMLAGAEFWGPVVEFPGVTGYKFRKDGNEIWMIWSIDAVPRQASLPSMPLSVTSTTGQALDLSQTLPVTSSPLYIVLEP